MKFRILALSATFALLAAGAAHAQSYTAASIRVDQPWARSTVAGQPAAGGFVKLTNTGATDDTLVSIQADVSASVELHTTSMDGDVMRMRQVDGIPVPAGQTVELKPGGDHIMFVKPKAPLKEGGSFPATLVFQKAGPVKVEFKIQSAGASSGGAMHGMKGMDSMNGH